MKQEEFTIAVDGVAIYTRIWQPEVINHLIILVHGFGEHSGRYNGYVADRLMANGAAVLGFDNVGHGKSAGKKGYCKSYDQLLLILDAVIAEAKKRFPEQPVFLYSHSMGGNLALNYALLKKSGLSGIVASSPFLRLAFQPPSWKLALGKLLLKIVPTFTLPLDLDTSALSKNSDEVKAYEEDSWVHNRISPNFSFPVMEAGEWAIKNADKLEIPVLMMHGIQDQIIDSRGSIEFSEKSTCVDLQLFEDGYHELHNDMEKEEVLDTAVNWINALLKR